MVDEILKQIPYVEINTYGHDKCLIKTSNTQTDHICLCHDEYDYMVICITYYINNDEYLLTLNRTIYNVGIYNGKECKLARLIDRSVENLYYILNKIIKNKVVVKYLATMLLLSWEGEL